MRGPLIRWRGSLVAVALGVALLGGLAAYSDAQVRAIEAAYPPPGEFVTVDGTRIHYLRRGTGHPVVLIHGSLGSVHDFRFSILDRVAERCQAIAVDRPGHGYSARPPYPLESPTAHARFVHGLVQALGLERPVLVGHSWGGAVALAYALEYPDAAAGLVVLGTVATGWNGTGGLRNLVPAIPLLGGVATHALYLPVTAAFWPPPAPTAPNAAVDGPLAADYHVVADNLALRPGHFRAEAEDTRHLGAALQAMEPRYGAIRLPVAIVHGEADDKAPLAQHALPLAGAVPGARLVVLPDAGHGVQFNHPDAVLDAIAWVWEQAGVSDPQCTTTVDRSP